MRNGIATSGALLALLGLFAVFAFVPESSFPVSYDELFGAVSKPILAAFSGFGAACGLAALMTSSLALWRVAHWVGAVMFAGLALIFAPEETSQPILLIFVWFVFLNFWLNAYRRKRAAFGKKLLYIALISLLTIVLWPGVWPFEVWLKLSASWTGTTTYGALAANAWVRMQGTYREPMWK